MFGPTMHLRHGTELFPVEGTRTPIVRFHNRKPENEHLLDEWRAALNQFRHHQNRTTQLTPHGTHQRTVDIGPLRVRYVAGYGSEFIDILLPDMPLRELERVRRPMTAVDLLCGGYVAVSVTTPHLCGSVSVSLNGSVIYSHSQESMPDEDYRPEFKLIVFGSQALHFCARDETDYSYSPALQEFADMLNPQLMTADERDELYGESLPTLIHPAAAFTVAGIVNQTEQMFAAEMSIEEQPAILDLSAMLEEVGPDALNEEDAPFLVAGENTLSVQWSGVTRAKPAEFGDPYLFAPSGSNPVSLMNSFISGQYGGSVSVMARFIGGTPERTNASYRFVTAGEDLILTFPETRTFGIDGRTSFMDASGAASTTFRIVPEPDD